MNIIKLILKPALQRKFDLKQIDTCLFIANTVKDTLELRATGTGKDLIFKDLSAEPLKLSDNRQYLDMFESNIKENVTYDTLNLIYLKLDFSNNKINTEVFYTKDGKKLKQNLEQKL